jgi:hypothetical protein
VLKTNKIIKHTGSQNKTEITNSMTAKTEEIDLTDITRNTSQPTLISITKARREISRQLQSMVCADPETKDHGQSYLVWEEADWLKKRQVTAPIVPATNPGVYAGTTHLALEMQKRCSCMLSRNTTSSSYKMTMEMS